MLELLLEGAGQTLKLTGAALLFGLSGGTILGILNCSKCRIPWLGYLIHGFVSLIRGTPLFVQVLIFYFAIPQALHIDLSPFAAGVIALGLNSSAYLSEIVRCGINAISIGQWEAAYALGYSRPQTLTYIIVPQMARNVLPAIVNEVTSLIKETSILMVIGVSELTKVGRDIVSRELDPLPVYLAVAALYFAMTSILSLIGHAMERRWRT